MRIVLFAKGNMKEILRDPVNFFFGLGFPLILLVLLSVINSAIPPEANNPMFAIENLAPGLAMFGTAFLALFAGMLLSKDRTSSFLMRLFTSPMTSLDFILGYTLPMLIMALVQAAITLLAAGIAGLEITIYILPAIEGNYIEILPHLAVVLGYTVVIFVIAVIIFQRKMSGDKA